METIKVESLDDVPGDFTGIAEFLNGSKEWFKKGKWHREEGPAVEYPNGYKEWWIEGKRHRTDGPAIEDPRSRDKEWWIEDEMYAPFRLKGLIRNSFFLGKQKGRYNLDWLKFLTSQGIREFPVVPGMETYKSFVSLFGKVLEVC